jgi:hypothetical protein
MKTLKSKAIQFKYEIAGALAGAVAGWCYWYFVGCSNGACLITGRPLNSSIYGALTGSIAFSLLRKK